MNEKLIAAIGPVAGIAAGGVSAAIGSSSAKKSSLFEKSDFLTCSGNRLVNGRGEEIKLLIFSFPDMITDIEERRPYSRRFGAYGEASLLNAKISAFLSDKDLDAFVKDGCTAVRISFGYQFIYPSGRIKGSPDFSLLEKLLDACRTRGIYAILNLYDATELRAKKQENAKQLINLWGEIARHFACDASVAAYDLKCSVDAGDTGFIESAISSIRKKKDTHAIILNYGTNVKDGNVIYRYSGEIKNCSSPCIFLETSTDFRKLNGILEKGVSVELSSVKTVTGAGVYTAKSAFEYSDETAYEDLLAKIGEVYSTEKNFELAGGVLPCTEVPTGKSKNPAKGKFTFSAGLRKGKELYGIVRTVKEND